MKPNVCIGVPHLGPLPEYFVTTLLGLNKASYYVLFAENAPVDLARNGIVEAMLEQSSATHLFFMDADMVFPEEALERLLSLDLDIVSGTYYARTDTPVPHAYRFNRQDDGGVDWYTPVGAPLVEWLAAQPDQSELPNAAIVGEPYPILVDAVGAGCLLIKREVLEAVYQANSESHYPWFQILPGTKGGEDFEFCRRARELGYKVWVDFSVQCNHAAPGWMGREEFVVCFSVGQEDEYDFEEELQVEAGPRPGSRRRLPRMVLERAGTVPPGGLNPLKHIKELVGGKR
jgi:hypothetical protein